MPDSGIHPEELIPTTLVRDRFLRLKRAYYLMAGKVVVDVGSGTGFFADIFSRLAAQVYAVDLAFRNLKLGADLDRSGKVFFVNADAHALPFASDSVDVVFCSGVVEHFNHPEVFYEEVYRILKPTGYLVQSVDIKPALTFWLYRLTFLFDKLYSPDHPTLHKKTVLSDDTCTEFISVPKLRKLIGKRFEILDDERFAGLHVNVIHGSLVLVNKLFQLAHGGIAAEDHYADQVKNLDRPLFRFYRKLLPLIRILLHPRSFTFDALFHYMLLRKKSSS